MTLIALCLLSSQQSDPEKTHIRRTILIIAEYFKNVKEEIGKLEWLIDQSIIKTEYDFYIKRTQRGIRMIADKEFQKYEIT